MQETDLYQPIKTFLEQQGYQVKAEVTDCDVVALRDDEAPVIVELKRNLSLALLLQGVNRQSISDAVYVAVPKGKGKRFVSQMRDAGKLCRRLGLGLMSVRLADDYVTVHVDPAPYQPRKVARRRTALLKEFAARKGDPNTGGQTRQKIVTAYRQDCQRMAVQMLSHGATSPKKLRDDLGIVKASSILQKNYYGWFVRVERGIYDLTETGRKAIDDIRV